MRKIALFDVCFTLYSCNTTTEFFKYLKNKYFFRYYIFLLFQKLCLILKLYDFFNKYRVIFLSKLDVSELNNYLDNFYLSLLKNKEIGLVFNKMSKLRKQGYEIILISASIDIVIKKIANELNCKYYATELATLNGKFTGGIKKDLLNKNAKKHILDKMNNINYKESIAFSDAAIDLIQWEKIENKFLVTNGLVNEYKG